ncbi:MAG TPA: tetratricopeptide repeat protein [Acidobacteriota bacterium]|nr:tetratricopeptide repeat protein [Acidobacteriota bacterium]
MANVAWLLLFPFFLAQVIPEDELDQGFALLYSLDFDQAQQKFDLWSQQHPGDGRGPVAQAAGDLFAELHRLGVLEAQFFEEDRTFLESRPKLKPDPVLRERFNERLALAESLAKERLNEKPDDSNALFTLTLVYGLRADYSALILKENRTALKYTKQATRWAEKLLKKDPTYYDAYLATGISNYLIGSLFAPLRWLLRLGGYSGDREEGLRQLQLVADNGRLLAPFARLLLAIASLRAGHPQRARQLLETLRNQFPDNPLYAKEIARIDARARDGSKKH